MLPAVCRTPHSTGTRPVRPNYFLALQLSSFPAITAAITTVQKTLLEQLPAAQAALVDPQTAHMTVMVAALQTEEEVQSAEAAMESLPAILQQHDNMQEPPCIHLEGLSHFRNEV